MKPSFGITEKTTENAVVEKALEEIEEHQAKDKEEVVKTSVSLSKELHKKMKKFVLDKDMSIKEYLVQLIEKDLKKGH